MSLPFRVVLAGVPDVLCIVTVGSIAQHAGPALYQNDNRRTKHWRPIMKWSSTSMVEQLTGHHDLVRHAMFFARVRRGR
jgi:hypothetical protein